MKDTDAVAALSALAHDIRLGLFRLLVEAAPAGLTAGDLASRSGISPSSLSFHAAILERARLASRRRAGRHVLYAANLETVSEMMEFLTWNCCGGHPELCETLERVSRPTRHC